MGLTDILDQFIALGPQLSRDGTSESERPAEGVRDEVNAALLPVWQWLVNLKPAADETGVNWVLLDGAPSDETVAAVKSAIAGLAELSVQPIPDSYNKLHTEIALLGSWLGSLGDEIDARLAESNIDPEMRSRLLLPLRAHISELAVNRGSSEALSLAREAAGQAGEKKLSEGIAEKATYEQKRADWFRVGAVLAFALSIGWLIASYLAFGSDQALDESERMTQVIGRLAIGSALFALAIYLSREAGGHRARASAWQTVQLQMDTIDLYCASLPTALKDAIRLSFGLEVFSGSRLFSSLSMTPGKDGAEEPLTGLDLNQAASLIKAMRMSEKPRG